MPSQCRNQRDNDNMIEDREGTGTDTNQHVLKSKDIQKPINNTKSNTASKPQKPINNTKSNTASKPQNHLQKSNANMKSSTSTNSQKPIKSMQLSKKSADETSKPVKLNKPIPTSTNSTQNTIVNKSQPTKNANNGSYHKDLLPSPPSVQEPCPPSPSIRESIKIGDLEVNIDLDPHISSDDCDKCDEVVKALFQVFNPCKRKSKPRKAKHNGGCKSRRKGVRNRATANNEVDYEGKSKDDVYYDQDNRDKILEDVWWITCGFEQVVRPFHNIHVTVEIGMAWIGLWLLLIEHDLKGVDEEEDSEFTRLFLLMIYRNPFCAVLLKYLNEKGDTEGFENMITFLSQHSPSAHIDTVTPELITYIATLARFSMSQVESWQQDDSEFDLDIFYQNIIEIIYCGDHVWCKELLEEWNLNIFGSKTGRNEQPVVPKQPKPASGMESLHKAQWMAKLLPFFQQAARLGMDGNDEEDDIDAGSFGDDDGKEWDFNCSFGNNDEEMGGFEGGSGDDNDNE
uniref:Uncharacterized protein n=1 Tax=Moniliophthora roreri TaxID=221103 RepID=A0A0W0EYH6_MONRR